jgi:hypothetical protein
VTYAQGFQRQFFGRQLIGSAEMKEKTFSPAHGLTVQTQNQSSLTGAFHVRGGS